MAGYDSDEDVIEACFTRPWRNWKGTRINNEEMESKIVRQKEEIMELTMEVEKWKQLALRCLLREYSGDIVKIVKVQSLIRVFVVKRKLGLK